MFFKQETFLDRDRDGIGEYGTILELCAKDGTRLLRPLPTPLLSPSFLKTEKGGSFVRSGYCYQLYFSRDGSDWVPAGQTRVLDEDADIAEGRFLWLAWPASYGNSGKRFFLIDERGVVMEAENGERQYSGTTRVPAPAIAVTAGIRPIGVLRNGSRSRSR